MSKNATLPHFRPSNARKVQRFIGFACSPELDFSSSLMKKCNPSILEASRPWHRRLPKTVLGRAQETPQKAVIDQLFASGRPRRAPSEFIFGPEGAQEALEADPGMPCAATWRARAVPIASEAPPRPQRGNFGHHFGYFWGSKSNFFKGCLSYRRVTVRGSTLRRHRARSARQGQKLPKPVARGMPKTRERR